MQLERILAALHKPNKYVILQRLAARLIPPFVRKLLAIAPSVTNLAKRSNSGLVLN